MSNPYDKPISTNSSVLGSTLKFKGELTANEDLLIQGQIEGSINHSSTLTVGSEGKLNANVKAEFITVEGKVDGDLSAGNAVVVKEGADVKGNIFSPTVTLHEGSTFNGSIDMSGKEQPMASAPEKEAKPAESKQDTEKAEKSESTAKKPNSEKKRSASAA